MAAKRKPKPTWRNRIVGHGTAKAEDLNPNPLNWRAHPDAQRAALAGVLDEVGFVQDVIVNRTTGNLVDGHLRVDMARGKDVEVPFVEVELTEAEERKILATLDPLGALATADADLYATLVASVETNDEAVRSLLAQIASGDVDIDTSYEPGVADGRGLSGLTLMVPTDDMERVRQILLDHANDLSAEGGIYERMGTAAVNAITEWHNQHSKT